MSNTSPVSLAVNAFEPVLLSAGEAVSHSFIYLDESAAEPVAEPVRPRGVVIGRNSPCPCGSGRKFKACHRRAAP